MDKNLIKNIDVESVLRSLPDVGDTFLFMAPQEIDILSSSIYSGLNQGLEFISSQGTTDLNQQKSVLVDKINKQIKSNCMDLSVKDLDKKINISIMVETLMSK